MKNLSIYRIHKIVWMALKFFLQITLFQKRYKGQSSPTIQQKWERLVTKQAVEFKQVALSLGGLLIKVGQFLSTRADIMPASFLEELEGLTDRVPATPREAAIEVLEKEWNVPYQTFLAQLSEQPIASASIGEVYKGTLNDGTLVAIKIQRPNIERIIQLDFKAMQIVIWFAKRFTSFKKQIDFDRLLREMIDVIGAELNFLQEMKNGENFAERFANTEGLQFPVYHEAYSTRRVLVMDWIEGSRVTDLKFLEEHSIDRKQLAERVFFIFLEQVLEGGQFHADPHSGNILVKEDGTIVLIDFGMVGQISPAQTKSVIKMVEGILFQNYDRVIDSLEELKFLLPNANRQLLTDAIVRIIRAYESNELMQPGSFVVDQLLKDMTAIVRNEPIQMPAEFAFFGRAISTFVGVIQVLDSQINLFALAKNRVVQWTSKETVSDDIFNEETLKRLGKSLLPLAQLPIKLANYLEEPTRMRQYMQQRDLEMAKQRARIEKQRLFGMSGLLSLAALFFAIWSNHELLLTSSAAIFVLSVWLYRKER